MSLGDQEELFRLRTAGAEVAAGWDQLVNDDPRKRLDIDYWPEPQEERQLRPDWDWEDDPLR